MAWRWRIRHKLVLGLGLVVGIIALLLAGTLKGLASYSSTMKSIASKVEEQVPAKELLEAVGKLAATDQQGNPLDEKERIRQRMQVAVEALARYENRLQDTIRRHRDPDNGYSERGTIGQLHRQFDRLDRALEEETGPAVREETSSLVERKSIKDAIHRLEITSRDLHAQINQRILDFIRDSRGYYQESTILVISTSVLGVLLMSGLLRFFYRWVFNPVRDLEEGARHVAGGDFEHRIEVHSGDEMEDLAAAFNDMTGRLHEMYRDLAHQVNERSRQLVRSERLASVGFLAAGVAHEINNPLASIAFCSEALESRLADVLAKAPEQEEVVTKYLRMIQQEAFRCKSITQRLLEFSRTAERRRESTDLGELVQSVLDVVQHLQNSKGKQIIFEPARRVVAWVNAQEIKSVILNLVVNALDSMDEDGTLTITLTQRNRMAELIFTDTGCGMSQEILENIFEPFFTRSRTGKGTGLGLSISHRVITQHGGEIEATSPGLQEGSTFTVRLPLQPAESAKEEFVGRAAA